MTRDRHVFRILLAVALLAVGGTALLQFDPIGHVAYALERGRLRADQEALNEVSSQDVATLENLSRAFNRVAAVVKPSVVNISTIASGEASTRLRRLFGDSRRDVRVGTGSGVIMDTAGHVITNNHVIRNAVRVDVTLADGRRFKADVVGTDRMTDLALLKIDADRLHPASFGDSEAVQVGDIVMAIGSPFRLDQTVSHGIISAKGRTVDGLDIDYQDFLQTDAPINPGNSGGPLVNTRGQVIGINTAIATDSGGYQGVGFSIPSAKVREVVDQLKLGKKVVRGFLGIEISDVEPGNALAMGLEVPRGATIGGVLPDGPAAKGGLKYGDVVLEIDGRQVKNRVHLSDLIARTSPGTKIRMKVWRDRRYVDVNVVVGQQPDGFTTRGRMTLPESAEEDDDEPGVSREPSEDEVGFDGPNVERFGLRVTTVTSDLAEHIGIKGVIEGALIVDIDPAGDAFHAGLRRGEIVVRVDKQRVRSAEDLDKALAGATAANRVRLVVRTREGSRSVWLPTP